MFFIEVSRDNQSSSKHSLLDRVVNSGKHLPSETSIAASIRADRKPSALRLRLSIKPTQQDASQTSKDLSPASMARRTVHTTHCKILRSRIMPRLENRTTVSASLRDPGLASEPVPVSKHSTELAHKVVTSSSPSKTRVKVRLERLPQPGLEIPAENPERPPLGHRMRDKSLSIESLFKLDLTQEGRRTHENHKTITSMREGKNQAQRIDTNCDMEDLLQKNTTFMAFVSLKRVQTAASSGVAVSLRKAASKASFSAQ
jgi:hypothetical protein